MENIRIAKRLVALAKELVGMARFTDGLGEDSDDSNAKYDRQYERIVRSLYPRGMAETIIMGGRMLEMQLPIHATMGNGNIVLKYYADKRAKQLIIEALVSEKHRLMPSDTRDIIELYNFLKKQVEDGYTIMTDCNTYSITFLATFARKNGYYFHAGEARVPPGGNGNSRDMTRMCICCKEKPDYSEDDNSDEFTKERQNLDRLVE